ncbi:MAG: hypothetical protein ACLGI6_16810, partial [Gammaproteobacteria bacterium]
MNDWTAFWGVYEGMVSSVWNRCPTLCKQARPAGEAQWADMGIDAKARAKFRKIVRERGRDQSGVASGMEGDRRPCFSAVMSISPAHATIEGWHCSRTYRNAVLTTKP